MMMFSGLVLRDVQYRFFKNDPGFLCGGYFFFQICCTLVIKSIIHYFAFNAHQCHLRM